MNWAKDNIWKATEYYHHIFQIPISVFQDNEFVFAIPSNGLEKLAMSIKEKLFFFSDGLAYYQTDESLFYGAVAILNSPYMIVTGPISGLPFTNSELASLSSICGKNNNPIAIKDALGEIPQYSQLEFIDYLLLMQYNFNQVDLSRDDFFEFQRSHIPDSAKEHYIYDQSFSDDGPTFLTEPDVIINYIEIGKPDEVLHYLCQPQSLDSLHFTGNNISQHKQIGYYSIALFSTAAHTGGLPMSECIQIVSNYYSILTKLDDIEQIDYLIGRCAMFFAEKVQSISIPANVSGNLMSAIRFVRQNVYSKISVDDIAAQLGYSRSHTSRIFHENFGFSPGEFIIRTKLEESKMLLVNSDKSISEISSMLLFSSQSHFQSSFKKQYGITPLKYRKSVDKTAFLT